MRTCVGCRHAEWLKTANGRLHPSGQGQCKYPYKVPALPSAFYWTGWNRNHVPVPLGGGINRRKELKDHCPYWSPAVATQQVKKEPAP